MSYSAHLHAWERFVTKLQLTRLSQLAYPRSTLILIALVMLPFILFGAETLGQRVFYHFDLQIYSFPYHKLVADVTEHGNLPLWNPYAFSGIPLLADLQTATFYPPNWLFWLFPAAHALTLSILLHFGIAGAGMFLYMRSLRFDRTAACIAALSYMFSGFLVARVVHPMVMAGAALIPSLFWGVELWLQRRRLRPFFLASALVALEALTGHPQIPIYAAIALSVYVLTIALQAGWRTRRADPVWILIGFAAIYLIAYALTAIQFVPWLEFASFSPRAAAASYEFVNHFSLSGNDWLLFLFPYGYGGLQTSWLQTLPASTLHGYLWERLTYVGILPLALAAVGLIDFRRLARLAGCSKGCADAAVARLQADRLGALLLIFVLMLLMAAGSSTLFGHLVYVLPLVSKLRAPSRAVSVASFVLPVLAGYGIQRLKVIQIQGLRRPDRAACVAGLLLLITVSSVLIVANRIGWRGQPTTESEWWGQFMLDQALKLSQANAYVPLILAVVSAGLLGWSSFGLTRLKTVAIAAVIAVDLLGFATSFNPTTDPAVFAQVPASVQFLRRDSSLYRIATFAQPGTLPPAIYQDQLGSSWSLAYGIEDINGYNPLQPRRYTDFLFGAGVEDVSYGVLDAGLLNSPQSRLLSMLDVKYALIPQPSDMIPGPPWTKVFTDDYVSIYSNPNHDGRAYFPGQVSLERDPGQILAAIKQPDFQPQRQAYVETGLDLATAQRVSNGSAAQVQVERLSPNELRIHTQTTTERFLVLNEMWFPGWQAETEAAGGEATQLPIYRTNYLFRGLIVPAGEHTIRMVYRPVSLIAGAVLTLLTLAGCVAAWAVTAWRGHH